MCAVAVIVGSVLALLAIVMLARWEARKKDERARREGLVVDGRPVSDVNPEPDEPYHDADRCAKRDFVTVNELIERERNATQRIPIVTRWRPSPYPRSGRR